MRGAQIRYANDGPWKCEKVGTMGDILCDGKLYGSLHYLNALEIVRQLNQRHRWLKDVRAERDLTKMEASNG